MTRREFSLALAGATVLAELSPAQETEPVIRVDVDLVNFVFSVRKSGSGELAPNLTQDDFQVFEDGKPQTIAHFSRERDLPFELGMLIDVSKSQTRLIETERQAGSSFFGSVIRPHDEAFVLAFGVDTVLLQDFTGSVPKLKAALDAVKADPIPGRGRGGDSSGGGGYPGGGGGGGYPGGGSYPGGGWPGRRRGGMGGRRNPPPDSTGDSNASHKRKGTLMFDSIYLAATEELAHKEGRKAVLLITDGEDSGSYYSREQAIEAAQRANVILFSIYYADPKLYELYHRPMPTGGIGELQALGRETGGRMFRVEKDRTLEDAFAELQAELRSQYTLAFKSTDANRNGEFREVEIRTKTSGYEVSARKGYFATRSRVG